MMEYRELDLSEVDLIKTIDATCYIKNAWRLVDGKVQLVELNWTDYELPNGLTWHMERFNKSITSGGKAYGCFDNGNLVGYATINSSIFGKKSKYVLLDQLFISNGYRNKGIGKKLFNRCKEQAINWGANKIYLCAGSSEDTIAFYKNIGCVASCEIDEKLQEEDPNDIQLEYQL